MRHQHSFKNIVQIFPQDKGWHYVQVPNKISKTLEIYADRGLIAVTVHLGASHWATSLLPKGDGTHFIALPAKVRDKESIHLGDTISVSFDVRR